MPGDAVPTVPVISLSALEALLGSRGCRRYLKRVPTRAFRMDGPFVVDTSEGQLRCEDGWLCIDARGYPYPVDAAEFELIYGGASIEEQTYGQVAFDSYAAATGGRTYDGRPIPPWGELTDEIRDAWCIAASRTIRAYREISGPS